MDNFNLTDLSTLLDLVQFHIDYVLNHDIL